MKSPFIRRTAPPARLDRMLHSFLDTEYASGLLMILVAWLALFFANSDLHSLYERLIEIPLSFGIGDYTASMPFNEFVKDVLMVVFFLVVGMELKREMLEGALSQPGQKILPLFAAAGGIAVPALIYYVINRDVAANMAGWAVPTATDIAFAICIVGLLGKRVPIPAKVFLLAIAIYDDLAAILIIAFFYSSGLEWMPLAGAGLVTLGMVGLNFMGVARGMYYLIPGIALWFLFHEGGIHSTIAGVITGLAVPMRVPVDTDGDGEDDYSAVNHIIEELHPWVALIILPLFAIVSAGVSFHGLSADALLDPLPLGIALALFVGKPVGILLFTFLCVRLGLAALPEHTNWRLIYGIGIVAGIGFTMSLFVGQLAFPGAEALSEVKLGVLAGSFLSAIVGLLFLRFCATSRPQA